MRDEQLPKFELRTPKRKHYFQTHKMNAKNHITGFVLFCFLSIFSIPELSAQHQYLQGYEETIAGTNFTYHSPLPDVDASLLVRARADYEPISWRTEKIPQSWKGERVQFIWVYGIDVSANTVAFDLLINGEKWLTFTNPATNEAEEMSFQGKHASTLTLRKNMVDKHKDQMGFAVLDLPVAQLKKGRPLKLTVDGGDQNSNLWFMTYRTALRESSSVEQNKIAVKNKDGLNYVARFHFTHLGEPTTAQLKINNNRKKVMLQPGHNSFDLLLPAVKTTKKLTAATKVGNNNWKELPLTIAPIKEWTIYLVQHSHTDIGYTRPQTEILADHLRYIDYALDYCDQTDNYPEDAQFRWTCEASWAVREYLKSRPQSQIDRLLKRIKEGRIEVTGMFFNFSDVVSEAALAQQVQPVKRFKENGIVVETAMQNDVNGIGWSMIDYFAHTDVKYLTMGQHGHRARIPFDKPTSFYWQSKAGNRLLAYRSEHYMHGNALSLTSGYIDVFRDNLIQYLNKLERRKYPFDRTAIQFSGYVTDNSPPSTLACDIVKEWNEKYEWPKLKLTLASEFMRFVNTHKANQLPVKQVAWPDWWTDGFGSAMNETKAARNTSANLVTTSGLQAMARLLGNTLPENSVADISSCYDNLLFYSEHTFGSSESISDPMSESTTLQWNEKAAYVWTARKQEGILREKILGVLQSNINKQNVPTLTVFNTLSRKRSGFLTSYIVHRTLPPGYAFTITDSEGKEAKAYPVLSHSDGTYWMIYAEDVPAFGFKSYRINVQKKQADNKTITSKANVLENRFYRIEIDEDNGGISSLIDKELDHELLDKDAEHNLGQLIYEEIRSRRDLERLTNSNRDTTYREIDRKWTLLKDVEIVQHEKNDIFDGLLIKGRLDNCVDERGIEINIKLFHSQKRITLNYSMNKLENTSPEALYVAFPFHVKNGSLSFDVQGGSIEPGVDQLEGTAHDWNTIQTFAAVQNDEEQILFSSVDVPLVQFGAINTGRFYYKHRPQTNHIYSWVLNNYWTTNFKASQSGGMKWTYTLTSGKKDHKVTPENFGLENYVPLAARVLPAGTGINEPLSQVSLLPEMPDNVLLVNATATPKGDVILQLRESRGGQANVDFTPAGTNTHWYISEVNVIGEPLRENITSLSLDHFETKFIKITMK